jgi:glutaminyl-tRNA synthetase
MADDSFKEFVLDPLRALPELHYQFERIGYFALDKDSTPGKLVFNRTIPLQDAWVKETQKA